MKPAECFRLRSRPSLRGYRPGHRTAAKAPFSRTGPYRRRMAPRRQISPSNVANRSTSPAKCRSAASDEASQATLAGFVREERGLLCGRGCTNAGLRTMVMNSPKTTALACCLIGEHPLSKSQSFAH
jgi:hypothetical protein